MPKGSIESHGVILSQPKVHMAISNQTKTGSLPSGIGPVLCACVASATDLSAAGGEPGEPGEPRKP